MIEFSKNWKKDVLAALIIIFVLSAAYQGKKLYDFFYPASLTPHGYSMGGRETSIFFVLLLLDLKDYYRENNLLPAKIQEVYFNNKSESFAYYPGSKYSNGQLSFSRDHTPLDYYGTPIKVSVEKGESKYIITFQSAGENKQFGDSDDIMIKDCPVAIHKKKMNSQ